MECLNINVARPNTVPNKHEKYVNYFYKASSYENLNTSEKIISKPEPIITRKLPRSSSCNPNKIKQMLLESKMEQNRLKKSQPFFAVNAYPLLKAYELVKDEKIDSTDLSKNLLDFKYITKISRYHSEKYILGLYQDQTSNDLVKKNPSTSLISSNGSERKNLKVTIKNSKKESKEKSFGEDVRNLFELIDNHLYVQEPIPVETQSSSSITDKIEKPAATLIKQNSELHKKISIHFPEKKIKRRTVQFTLSQSKSEINWSDNNDTKNETEESSPKKSKVLSPTSPSSYLSSSFDHSLSATFYIKNTKKRSNTNKKTEKPKYIVPIFTGPFGSSLKGKKIKECTDFGVLFKSSSASKQANPYNLSSSILKRNKVKLYS
ncbi:unnamed protein product [Blepharisma stoltei]|uniref:Uncharacterized protein n=1 Tax=Blepharisma stoltei TaxID=1481888 RepID=A0AAU9J511_9CILI|nr:unnamed protein product [Blepharisma stoltei]